MHGVLNKLSTIIIPPRCVICQRSGTHDHDLCVHCYQQLPLISQACSQCALPLAVATATAVCGQCLQSPPYYDSALSVLRYEGVTVSMITQYKFYEKLCYARLFAELMLKSALARSRPECFIAVPLHNHRLRERGFNQSHEIAKMLSCALDIPVLSSHVVRTRNTAQQSGLNAQQRRSNIKGAFELVQAIPYRHVALVDDVVTTGSTVNELARILKRAGIARVDVWSVARAL
jgi:ComF family protein